jgi:hypothetical protein
MPWSKDSDCFIERSALGPVHDKMNAEQIRTHLRAYCLNNWLQSARKVRYIHAEAGNG